MTHRLYAALTSLLLVAALPLTVLATHDTDPIVEPSSSAANSPTYWEGLGFGECEKFDSSGNGPYVLPAAPEGYSWTLLLFKQARENIYWVDPVAGHSYYEGEEWSHLIRCLDTSTSTSTSQPTTTTESSTTTTDPTTTTAPSTTSSSQGSSTSTSTIDSTTTSNPTTTSSEGSTSTSSDSTTSSSVSQTTDPTLPFTGTDDTLGLLALALISGGVFLVTFGRSLVSR